MKTKFYLVMASVLFLFSCTDDFLGDGSSIKRVVVCYYDAELDDYNTVSVTVEEAELMITYGAYLGVCEDEETDPRTFVPDDAFEQGLINLGLDDVLDDYVLTENISSVEKLKLDELGIEDLTGIEDFISLIELEVVRNSISVIDITSLSALELLWIQDNDLETLDISQNKDLRVLRFERNNLSTIDLSQNSKLEELKISGNNFTSIDVSNLESLGSLWVDYNQIIEIDVTNNPNLFALVVRGNPMTELNVNSNPLLTRLEFFRTQINSIDLTNNNGLEILRCQETLLESLDLSGNNSLRVLNCRSNPSLTSLNLQNGNNLNMNTTNTKINLNPALSCIQVDDVAYAEATWIKDDTATFSEDCSSL